MKNFKYTSVLVIIFIVMLLLVGCGPKTGNLKGMDIYVTAGADVTTRSAPRYFPPDGSDFLGQNGQSADYYHPKNLKIAFNKVWFAESDTYDLIKNENTNEISSDKSTIFIKDRTTIPQNDFYKPIDEYTVISASKNTPFTPSALPEYGMEYKGVLIDIVFVEYEMEDFSIRWYCQDHDDYRAKDVVLFEPNSTTPKFPYYYRSANGDLTFRIEDTRKDVEIDPNKLQPNYQGQPNTFEGYFTISGKTLAEYPFVIAGHATPSNPEPVNNPTIIETFGHDENEAQYYLLQICLNADADFSSDRYNGFEMTPGLKHPQSITDSLDYAEFRRIIDVNLTDTDNSERDPLDVFPDDSETTWIRTVVSAVGSGIDTRFGWIDFEGNPQGGFSPNAGW